MIEVKGLKKEFDGLKVLNGIDYTINQGEKIVVIGPSGSGKSTFLRCLNLLEEPTGGEIWFDGTNITDPQNDINKMRQKMGMVFQHFNLFPHMTVLDNITFAPVRLIMQTKAEAKENALRLLRRIGLSGKSIVPMLIGFGCTVPAVMATRTLTSERDRKMTILLTPFMSCTAKLPIYSFFVSVFFPGKGGLIMSGLYLLGILVGIGAAFLYKDTLFRGEPIPFVMELPNYRLPSVKNVGQLLWEKAKDFLQRAFSVILIATVVVWFLQSFDLQLNMVSDSADSILARISGILVPLFAPLGLGDWRICTALISGFMAKESVVSTLEVLFGGTIGSILSPLSAGSLLVFSLLYTPCVAAVASVRRELGGKWAAGLALWQCLIAWVVAFVIHGIGALL